MEALAAQVKELYGENHPNLDSITQKVLAAAEVANTHDLQALLTPELDAELSLLDTAEPVEAPEDDSAAALDYYEPSGCLKHFSWSLTYDTTWDPDQYFATLGITPDVQSKVLLYSVKNTLDAKAMFSAQKPLLLETHELDYMFAHTPELLPPECRPGANPRYPMLVWHASAVPGELDHEKAFAPIGKGANDWKTSVTSGSWHGTPVFNLASVFEVMQQNPGILIGDTATTSATLLKIKLRHFVAKAPWGIKKMLAMGLIYKLVQDNVVKPVVRYFFQNPAMAGFNPAEQYRQEINRWQPAPMAASQPNIKFDWRPHGLAYGDYLKDPRAAGTPPGKKSPYALLVTTFSGHFDSLYGYQAFTVSSDNRLVKSDTWRADKTKEPKTHLADRSPGKSPTPKAPRSSQQHTNPAGRRDQGGGSSSSSRPGAHPSYMAAAAAGREALPQRAAATGATPGGDTPTPHTPALHFHHPHLEASPMFSPYMGPRPPMYPYGYPPMGMGMELPPPMWGPGAPFAGPMGSPFPPGSEAAVRRPPYEPRQHSEPRSRH
jgi:hypothetical protein